MKTITRMLSRATLCLFLPSSITCVYADCNGFTGEFGCANVTANFTATISGDTCLVTISGGVGDDASQTITIGDSNGQVSIDDVNNNSSTASKAFTLNATECPLVLPKFNTTIEGEQEAGAPEILKNQASVGAAEGVGIYISTAASPSIPLTLKSKIDYTNFGWIQVSKDIFTQSIKAELYATLTPVPGGNITSGDVMAQAVFHFDYD